LRPQHAEGMKNKNTHKRRNPAKHKLTALHQLSKLIPAYLVAQAAKESGLDKKNLKFCPWSHVLSLMFAQLSRTASLWDLCANLRFHAAKFTCIRGAYVPARKETGVHRVNMETRNFIEYSG
jgi:hypothetical protein